MCFRVGLVPRPLEEEKGPGYDASSGLALVSCPAPLSRVRKRKGLGKTCIEPVSPVQPTVCANQMHWSSHMTARAWTEYKLMTVCVCIRMQYNPWYMVANGMLIYLCFLFTHTRNTWSYIPRRYRLYTRLSRLLPSACVKGGWARDYVSSYYSFTTSHIHKGTGGRGWFTTHSIPLLS